MMKKRLKAAAAAAMALAMLGGALPAVPGGAELLNTPLTAHAAGSVTLDEETGVLTLSGAVTKEQIEGYWGNHAVESIVAADDCVLPAHCDYLFGTYSDAYNPWTKTKIIDLSKADASAVTNMEGMFYGLRNIELNLSGIDTSNVKCMNSMFERCKLTSLDLSNFDTSNVTDMWEMFYNCVELETIYVFDLWNTNHVIDLMELIDEVEGPYESTDGNEFKGCTKLKGGAGTAYDKNHIDKEYARIDGKDGKPGYLTYNEHFSYGHRTLIL